MISRNNFQLARNNKKQRNTGQYGRPMSANARNPYNQNQRYTDNMYYPNQYPNQPTMKKQQRMRLPAIRDTTATSCVVEGVSEITCVKLNSQGNYVLVGTECGKLLGYKITLDPLATKNEFGYKIDDTPIVGIEWVPPGIVELTSLAFVALGGAVLLLDFSKPDDILHSVNFQSPRSSVRITTIWLSFNGLLSIGFDNGDYAVFDTVPLLKMTTVRTGGSMVQTIPYVQRKFPAELCSVVGCKSVCCGLDRTGTVFFKDSRVLAGVVGTNNYAGNTIKMTNSGDNEVEYKLELQERQGARGFTNTEYCLGAAVLCGSGLSSKDATAEVCFPHTHFIATITSNGSLVFVCPQPMSAETLASIQNSQMALARDIARRLRVESQVITYSMGGRPACIFSDSEIVYVGCMNGVVTIFDLSSLKEETQIRVPSVLKHSCVVTAGDAMLLPTTGISGKPRLIAYGSSATSHHMFGNQMGRAYVGDCSELCLKLLQ